MTGYSHAFCQAASTISQYPIVHVCVKRYIVRLKCLAIERTQHIDPSKHSNWDCLIQSSVTNNLATVPPETQEMSLLVCNLWCNRVYMGQGKPGKS